jgi:hypothetical protein
MLTDLVRILSRALKTTFGNPTVVIPVLLVPAILLGISDTALFQALDIDQGGADANMEILKVALAWQGTSLLTEIFYGPIFVATAIYLGRAQGPATLYGALNFALNRYGRLFKWHAAAYVLINVGMIVILPGVLYTLNYAFVDSVCCIEDERWPLSRSTRLTRGRRQRIFLIFLPYFIYVQVAMVFYLKLVDNWLFVSALHTVTYAALFTFSVAMYVLYEERTAPKSKAAVLGATDVAGALSRAATGEQVGAMTESKPGAVSEPTKH